MANTLTIDLDDSAALTSLDQMIQGLGEAQTETEALAAAGQQVIENQTQQITVIQKQTVEMKTFAQTGVEAMRDVALEAIDTAGKIGLVVVSGKAVVSTIKALKGAHQEKKAEVMADTEAVEKNNSSMLMTIAAATPLTFALKTLAGEWTSQKELATGATAAYAKLRLGLVQTTAIALGVTATIKVLDALNEKFIELERSTEGLESDLGRLENSFAGLGKNITRPFAEVGPAVNNMLATIKEDVGIWFKDIQREQYEYWNVKEWVDYSTKSMDDWSTFFENWVDEARGNFVKFEDSALKAFGFQGDSNAARYVEEAKALRDLAAWHEKMDKVRANEKDGFEAIAAANKKYQQQLQDQTRTEEIGAVKTVADVNKMIEAARKLASDRVQAGYKVSQYEADQHQKRLQQIEEDEAEALKSAKTKEDRARISAEAYKRLAKEEAQYRAEPARIMYEELNALERRRTQIIEEEKNARIEKAKAEAEQMKRAYDSLNETRTSQTRSTALDTAKDNGASEKELHDMRMRWIDEEAEERAKMAKSNADLIEIEADAEKKRITEIETFRRDEIRRSAESRLKYQQQIAALDAISDGVQKARDEFNDAMELQSLKLQLEGQQNFAAKTKQQIEDERQRRLNAAAEIHQKQLDIIERETQRNVDAAKTREQEAKAIADGEMKRLRAVADYQKQTQQEAHDHAIKLAEDEQRKKDELKAKQVENLKPNAEAIIGLQSQQDRIRELQRIRGQAAKDNAVKEAGFDKFEDVPPEVKRQAAKAEQDARRQALKDAMRGNVGADEQAQVASNLADKTIQQFGKQGKLTGDVIDNQRAAVQAMAQQQANIDALSRESKQVKDMIQAVINASEPTRNRAGFGGQRG